MDFKEKNFVQHQEDVYDEFSVESSVVEVESLPEITVKVKW